MSKIISMSLDEELLKKIDTVKKSVGFKGRSETIRSGIKILVNDIKEKERLKGHLACVLIIVHEKKFENAIIKTTHRYEDIISTQVHNNICNDKCLEIFVLHGEADKIKNLFSDVRKNKKIEYVKLIVP